jgi:hypothetical protein
MKPNILKLLNQCIEDGVAIGYSRAHKHTESPSVERITECISKEIEMEIHEWFDVLDDNGPDVEADQHFLDRIAMAGSQIDSGAKMSLIIDDMDAARAVSMLGQIIRLR